MKKASNQDKKQKHNNKKEKQNEKDQQPDKKDRKIIISKKDEVPSLAVEQKQEPETLKLEIENNWKFYQEIELHHPLGGRTGAHFVARVHWL